MRKQAGKQHVQASAKSIKCAMYLRVSTDEQAESGLGIESQRNRCFAMATVKGWQTPVEYADEGVSGTKDASKRPALQQLLADVATGEIDAVIILSLDRLGRKTRLVLDLVDELSQYNVALVSCKESLDTTSPQGAFVLTLFAALAQLERDLIAERTKAALGELSRRGGRVAGRLPYGYRYEGQDVVVDEALAGQVRYIFNCSKRKDTLRAIAVKLNEKGVVGPRGGVWHHTSVREVLANRDAYAGGKRGLSDIAWPAILRVRAA